MGLRPGKEDGRVERKNARLSFLESDFERARHAQYWSDFPRKVQDETIPASGRSRIPVALTGTLDPFVRNRTSLPSGLLVTARERDGMSWASEACLQLARECAPERPIHILHGNTLDGAPPRVLSWIAPKTLDRVARKAGIVTQPGWREPGRLAPLVLAGALAILAALAGRWALDSATENPVLGRGSPIGYTGLILAAGLAFVSARLAADTSTIDRRRAELDLALAGPYRETSEGKVGLFLGLLANSIHDNANGSVFIVDNIDRVSEAEWEVLRCVLEATVEEPEHRDRSWPRRPKDHQGDVWVILRPEDSNRLPLSDRPAAKTRVKSIRRLTMLPLAVREREALALVLGNPGATNLELVKNISQASYVDSDLESHIESFLRPVNPGADPSIIDIVWLFALGASVGGPVNFLRKGLGERLAANENLSSICGELFGTSFTAAFFNSQIEKMLNEWKSILQRPSGAFVIKPIAATTIRRTSTRLRFRRDDLAALFWASYWDQRWAATGEWSALARTTDHLLDFFGNAADPNGVDEQTGGIPTELANRVIDASLGLSRSSKLVPLLGSAR